MGNGRVAAKQDGVPARCSGPQVLSPFPLIPLWRQVISENKVFGSKPKCILGWGEKPTKSNLNHRISDSHPDNSNACLAHPSWKPGMCACKWPTWHARCTLHWPGTGRCRDDAVTEAG